MRVLFYLPAVTPWWFDNVVEPLVRRLVPACAVHIVAPEPWRGTGIGPRELDRCADLPELCWTIIGGAEHPSLRTAPSDPDRLVEAVSALAPDHVLCRSADLTTPQRFPGRLHFLMEAGVPPVPLPAHWIWFADAPFDHGLTPELDAAAQERLRAWIGPAWARLRDRVPAARDGAGPRRLCIPLDYEHEENAFLTHRRGPATNADYLRELADRLAPGFVLDATNHPLNELHVDRTALDAAVASLAPRVTLGTETAAAIAGSDGVIVTDSKAFALAALFERPLCRMSAFRSADWLRAHDDPSRFQAAILAGTAEAPDVSAAQLWSAWHLAANVVDPQDPALTGDALLDRLDTPHDPSRWAAGMARVAAHAPELFG
jgi:hypothetical protein